jgi:hypothetical protein
MSKFKLLVSVAVASCLIATSAVAEEKKKAGTGPNPFRDCGIGAALFPSTPVAAITSNVIWDVGTTALTSATASPETCNGNQVAAAKFIYETYANVIEETAYGKGEHLTAMLEIFGCASGSHKAIISSVRSGIAESVNSPAYAEQTTVQKAADYYDAVSSTIQNGFSQSCSA